jgi:hypothetical protein
MVKDVPQGLKRVLKKDDLCGEERKNVPSGPKGRIVLWGFKYGLKRVPTFPSCSVAWKDQQKAYLSG